MAAFCRVLKVGISINRLEVNIQVTLEMVVWLRVVMQQMLISVVKLITNYQLMLFAYSVKLLK